MIYSPGYPLNSVPASSLLAGSLCLAMSSFNEDSIFSLGDDTAVFWGWMVATQASSVILLKAIQLCLERVKTGATRAARLQPQDLGG